MSALLAILASLLGAGGLIAAIEIWIRRREARAVEIERQKQDAHRAELADSIRVKETEIEARRRQAHAAIDARPVPTTREERLAEIKRRNRE